MSGVVTQRVGNANRRIRPAFSGHRQTAYRLRVLAVLGRTRTCHWRDLCQRHQSLRPLPEGMCPTVVAVFRGFEFMIDEASFVLWIKTQWKTPGSGSATVTAIERR
jgi:hypothetical protein